MDINKQCMSCMCEQRKKMSEGQYVSSLARKAAILDGCMYAVYKKKDGTYSFDRVGREIKGVIVEFRHYL